MSMHNLEVALTIGVLAAIFLGSFIVLILICRRTKVYYKTQKCSNKLEERLKKFDYSYSFFPNIYQLILT